MTWVQCEDNHTYNDEEHDSCPNCGQKNKPPKATVVHNPPAATVVQKGEEKKQKDSKKTVVKLKDNTDSDSDFDPVVGWLICVEGKSKGHDFRMLSGWNSIGRDPEMTICIPSDDTISRENHAKVLYDEKTKKFYLAEGIGRNVIYLNESALLQTTEINAYDLIELGNSKFRFLPFCGDQFNW